MRRARAWAAALALGAFPLAAAPRAAVAGDPAPGERAFVEVVTARDEVYVGEAVILVLRVGFDAAWFAENAAPMFLRSMDVPVQVEARWGRGEKGGPTLVETPRTESDTLARLSFALDGAVVKGARVADDVRDGRLFYVLEVLGRVVTEKPGALELPGPVLRFSHATRWRDDLAHGRTVETSEEVLVRGASHALRVLAPPAEGRPPEFAGAVGRFTIRASADRASVAVGESLHVTVVLEGKGPVESVEPPHLDALPGFHAYGAVDDRRPGPRAIVYEIAPTRADVREVPAIAFAYLDPWPPTSYRVVHSAPIPLDVRPRPGPGGGPGPGDVPPRDAGRGAGAGSALLAVLAGVALVVLGLAFLSRRRARGG